MQEKSKENGMLLFNSVKLHLINIFTLVSTISYINVKSKIPVLKTILISFVFLFRPFYLKLMKYGKIGTIYIINANIDFPGIDLTQG